MQGLQSQVDSLKGHLKDAINAKDAFEQEVQRLKGDLTTMTQENQVDNYNYTVAGFFTSTLQGHT